ncbi:hypothetical protein BDB00DRAFT_950566 [Zychaea mexicana]|uniref:uncharacterized protein n=1 Tax=Zychaea mexicana TaxID=64656 RepID=UPI0022FDDE42|nr:uncharacterized protein BDB00DRAFT_950566 [Zychaea mexicana]KAI9498130.1 hypothetical protein BDB00DRAFT_950566 [Zychaea mexicana]
MALELTSQSLERHCYGNICHCDWRVTIQDCVESVPMWHVHLWNIILSALAVVVGSALLVYRLFVRGHTLWSQAGVTRGLLRPKPIDSMILLFSMFNTLRMLTSIILVADVAPENMLARSFLFELPWVFGLSGLLFYFIGIAQAISQSHSASGWLPSASVIDIFGFSALIIPFLCSWSFTLALGALAKTDLATSELLMSINYGLWALWTGGTGTIIFVAGLRLVRILTEHHKKYRNSPTWADIKAGIFKLRMMALTLALCLWSFGTLLLCYAILRYEIIRTTAASIFLGVLWNLLAVVTTLLSFVLIIFDPHKSQNPALRTRSADETTGENFTASTTQPDGRLESTTLDGGTMSRFTDDNDVILNALKNTDQILQQNEKRKQSNENGNGDGSGNTNSNFFMNKIKPKKRESTTSFSSNVELTSYEAR